jgi:hypothetical protein
MTHFKSVLMIASLVLTGCAAGMQAPSSTAGMERCRLQGESCQWLDISAPHQCMIPVWEEPGQSGSIILYLAEQGITVYDIRYTAQVVCRGCECPPQYKIEILVTESSAERISGMTLWNDQPQQ